MSNRAVLPFHGYLDMQVSPWVDRVRIPAAPKPYTVHEHVTIQERSLSYRFDLHIHPYATQLVQELIEKSVRGLLDKDTEYQRGADGVLVTLADGSPRPTLYDDTFFEARYQPTDLVAVPHPVKELEFRSVGAYSIYNWELFFHIPITIAIHLSRNGRYEDAQRWFHYLFDPTDDSDGPTPERFWKVRPFQTTDVQLIEQILVNLATGADRPLREETVRAIDAWKDAPFRPHVVAGYRTTAYMFKTVMAYLDNLIDWGDSLFRQDTGEAINEATQLYVLAASILGERPQPIPRRESVRPQTYDNLRRDLDKFGNAMRALETEIPFDDAPHPTPSSESLRLSSIRSLANTLYFSVPFNDKLLGYWDTVADRLFKIRNSLNIQGIFRQLPLFEPPIDPALLARAAAAGLDVAAVVGAANQPLPLVRFGLLAQKANEICAQVITLGNGLLSAMEKEDNEALSVLRARHERAILGLAEAVKYGQLQEAIKNREGLEQNLANAAQRYTYYERLLGRSEADISIPDLDPIDTEALLALKLRTGEPTVGLRDVPVRVAQGLSGDLGGLRLNPHEAEEMDLLDEARVIQDVARVAKLLAQGLELLPDFGVDLHFWGLGGHANMGGQKFGKIASYTADVAMAFADRLQYEAGRAARIGGYERRELDWAFQSNSVAGEISLLFKQLRAAQIREALAEREWRNHQQQIKNAEEIERFLTDEKTGKRTNRDFYTWMKREVRALYGQCFQFAFDVAKKAERALRFELGDPSLGFIDYGYTSGREGLLAGEKLQLDLKRMEMAYIDLNRREYELTKHISLLQLDPEALLRLRQTGRCGVVIPEGVFDMDGPGHYFRRIKSVALTIPAVVGPYSTVSCGLRLLRSSIRTSSVVGDQPYGRTGPDDPRFTDTFGSLQGIVTSSGQNDAGMFELNLRDERYLPFEGAGVISEWQLEIPRDVPQFDLDTISDVILHVRYTAREGGDALRAGAVEDLTTQIDEADAAGSVRMFSVANEFPTEWARYKAMEAVAPKPFVLTLPIREEHYPFWSRGRVAAVHEARLYARPSAGTATLDVSTKETLPWAGTDKDALVRDASLGGLLVGRLDHAKPSAPTGAFTIQVSSNSVEAMWLAIRWGA